VRSSSLRVFVVAFVLVSDQNSNVAVCMTWSVRSCRWSR
jgi:hypothetical protein